MTTDVFSVEVTDSIVEVTEKMLQAKVSNAPVVKKDGDDEILVGLVTDRDLMLAFSSGNVFKDESLKVDTIMQHKLVKVGPDADLFGMINIFTRFGFRRVPVTDGDKLLGVLSRRNVLNTFYEQFKAAQAAGSEEKYMPYFERLSSNQ